MIKSQKSDIQKEGRARITESLLHETNVNTGNMVRTISELKNVAKRLQPLREGLFKKKGRISVKKKKKKSVSFVAF